MPPIEFSTPPTDKSALEDGGKLTPRFDADGLVTAVVTDAGDGMLLMVAHMNAEALSQSIETGVAHFWSRSRGKLWKKGEQSGNVLHVRDIHVDCDQDAIWLRVDVGGNAATCHTGRRSCFYRRVELRDGEAVLEDDGGKRLFDPQSTYGTHG